MAVTPLKVTGETSVKDLQSFAAQVGKDATIHGKAHKDGSVTLYVSKEGKGTGLKNYLFGTTEKRRAAANGVITQILFANTASTQKGKDLLAGQMGYDFTNILGSVPQGSSAMSGKTIKEIASMAQSAYDEAALPGNLPTGVNMDAKGNLTGGQVMTTVPTGCTTQFGSHIGKNIVDVLQEIKSKSIGLGATLVTIAGQKVASQCSGDFYRLDFDIPQTNGTRFQSTGDPAEDQQTRNENATRALRNFAGSDSATTVLSSILSQTTLTPIPGCLAKSDGSEAKYKFGTAFNTAGRDMTIRGADGKLNSVEPQFVGGAKWTLSKVGNDFKVSVSWQAYAEANPGDEGALPLHKDGVIGIHFALDMIVDGAEAAKGNLKLSMPGGVQTQFSGRLLA
jgi:hypothetical protein